MNVRLFGKNLQITPVRLALFSAGIILLAGAVWFGMSVTRYYRAIQSGETNPLLNQRLESSISTAIANKQVTERDLRGLYRSDAPSIGPSDAKLTIVEFLDFGCPYCRQSFEPVREITTKYKDQVRLVVRDFPLEAIHPGATKAAHAARCAKDQGKYWAYHDKLFVNQNAFSDAELEQYAIEVGANIDRFQECMRENRFRQAIESDVTDGLAAGVGGTPTFFFNGHRIQGALNAEMLELIIEQFLKQSS